MVFQLNPACTYTYLVLHIILYIIPGLFELTILEYVYKQGY